MQGQLPVATWSGTGDENSRLKMSSQNCNSASENFSPESQPKGMKSKQKEKYSDDAYLRA